MTVVVQQAMPLPISRIAKEIGSNHIAVEEHIRLLEEADLIISVQYGKRRLYKTQ